MKNIKTIIVSLCLVLIFIMLLVYIKKEINDTKSLTTRFSEIKASEITSITIRTLMTKNCPEEKVATDEEDILKIIGFLHQIKGTKLTVDEQPKGWQFWILFEGYSICILGDNLIINDDIYQINSSTSSKFMRIYEELKVKGVRYP